MKTSWHLKHFTELTPHELYRIMQLRIAVFIIEQQCIFQDADDHDQQTWHLCCWHDELPIAYTRILAPGTTFEEASIGRVVTAKQVRGQQIGRELMQRSITAVYTLFGKTPIKIGAQLYLQKFYESFGFQKTSDVYIEDDIPHIRMILS